MGSEERIGRVVGYFAKIGVAAVVLERSLRVGDTIRVKGHTTDFTQRVDSLEIEHAKVAEAGVGDSVAIRVVDRVRDHDVIYRVTD